MEPTLDPAILAVLPANCEIIAVNPRGKGSWSVGFKVDVESGGKKLEYFLKIIRRSNHKELAMGEFESQKELQKYLPDNVSVPLAHGVFELEPSVSFYLTAFRRMSENRPDPDQLVEVLDRLYRTSTSPNGKFGFHVPTFNGVVPLINDWCDTWEEYFTRQLRSDIHWMHSIRGPDTEFDAVADRFFHKVVPRLLRPLEKNIKPVLVHGDIWPGNVQIDISDQRVILFDSCCCYGHNELELAMMRETRYQFTKEHARRYTAVVPKSEPIEDFDDRNALYAMRDNIINAGLHDHRAFLREEVKQEMRRLLAKHPDGISGFKGWTKGSGHDEIGVDLL